VEKSPNWKKRERLQQRGRVRKKGESKRAWTRSRPFGGEWGGDGKEGGVANLLTNERLFEEGGDGDCKWSCRGNEKGNQKND